MQFSITNSKIDRKWIFYGWYILKKCKQTYGTKTKIKNKFSSWFLSPPVCMSYASLFVCDLTKIHIGPKFTRKKVICKELGNLGSHGSRLRVLWVQPSLKVIQYRQVGSHQRQVAFLNFHFDFCF